MKTLRRFVLGASCGFRAQAYDRLGDTQRAALDMQHALTILAKTSGVSTPGDRKTQQIYAGILRHAGDLQQAWLLEQQYACSGCISNMASVR